MSTPTRPRARRAQGRTSNASARPRATAPRSPRTLGVGDPLDRGDREFFEQRLGVSLDHARLHTDAAAAASAASVGRARVHAGAPCRLRGRSVRTRDERGPETPRTRADARGRAGTAAGQGTAPVQRQVAPGASAKQEPDPVDPSTMPDPIEYWRVKGWSFWLIGPDLSQLPTLDDLKSVLVNYGGVDSTALQKSIASRQQPGSTKGYWAFRHPTRGVVARAYGSRSGSIVAKQDVATYGVYLFMPDDLGERMWAAQHGTKGGVPQVAAKEDRPEAKGKPGGRGGPSTAEAALPPTPAEQEIAEKVAQLLERFGADPQVNQKIEPQELLRYYRLLLETVKDPQFTIEGGQSVVTFGRFLERNKDKIEGILRGNRPVSSRPRNCKRSLTCTANTSPPSRSRTNHLRASRRPLKSTTSCCATTRAGRSCPRRTGGCSLSMRAWRLRR